MTALTNLNEVHVILRFQVATHVYASTVFVLLDTFSFWEATFLGIVMWVT